MKTDYKEYKTIDVKGLLDENNDTGEKYIAYQDGDDTKFIKINELLDMMVGSYVQFKTISE